MDGLEQKVSGESSAGSAHGTRGFEMSETVTVLVVATGNAFDDAPTTSVSGPVSSARASAAISFVSWVRPFPAQPRAEKDALRSSVSSPPTACDVAEPRQVPARVPQTRSTRQGAGPCFLVSPSQHRLIRTRPGLVPASPPPPRPPATLPAPARSSLRQTPQRPSRGHGWV